MEKLNEYCELCHNILNDDNFTVVEDYEPKMLDILPLKWNFDDTVRKVICGYCSEQLFGALNFKSKCLENENTIMPYVDLEDPEPVDLKDIYMGENGTKGIINMSHDERICRLCIQPIDVEYISIQDIPQEIINIYIPELNLRMTTDPVICKNCCDSLFTYTSFIKECMDVERKRSTDENFVNASPSAECIKMENIDIKSEIESDRMQVEPAEALFFNIKSDELKEENYEFQSETKYNVDCQSLQLTLKNPQKSQDHILSGPIMGEINAKNNELTKELGGTTNEGTINETKRGKKRTRNINNWKKVKTKILKNSGQSYISRTGKTVESRKMGPPCKDTCVLSCSKKLTENLRSQLFKNYWELCSLQRQRNFLISCIEPLTLKYRRISAAEPRNTNCAFYVMDNDKKVRVCKTFLINTLGITERTIRTVIQAKVSGTGSAPPDKRGKHNHQKKLPEEVLNSVRNHINSIPRIESCYVREDTSREFIDGGLTIAEMHRHYSAERAAANKSVATYDTYSCIFNTEFNIGFFPPKKDKCDQCVAYENAAGEEKTKLEETFREHQEEEELSRTEKAADKEKAKKGELQLAVYGLQAVLPVPIGQTSAFCYKSRLNCFNFTVTEIENDTSFCFFWHEGLGHRGVNEIATGVYKYIEELSKNKPGREIVFYSDNCDAQQKNRYMIAMYLYAVQHLDVRAITHKYLMRGHAQNEGDAIHSIIERSVNRAKKSGPVYVPDQYVALIRNAKKKGKPLQVRELSYEDFADFKELHNEMALNIAEDSDGNTFELSDVKVLRFEKGSDKFLYKHSYNQEKWSEVQCKAATGQTKSISLKPAYASKIPLPDKKKEDLVSLCDSNIIPHYYKAFYQAL